MFNDVYRDAEECHPGYVSPLRDELPKADIGTSEKGRARALRLMSAAEIGVSQRLLDGSEKPHYAQCCPPSHPKSLTSSSTTCTTSRLRSERVASSLNHGFRVLDDTFSLRSCSTPFEAPSRHGWSTFRTLPTLRPTTRAPSFLSILIQSLLRLQSPQPGFTTSATSKNCEWQTSCPTTRSLYPSFNYMDSHLPSNSSIYFMYLFPSQKSSTSSVPSPFSKIFVCNSLPPGATPVGVILLRRRRDSPGALPWSTCPPLSCADC